MFKKIILTIKAIRNLHLFILEYLGIIKNHDLIYKLRNGTRLVVRAGSTDASELIIINGNLEYPKEFFPQKNRPVILDIGANIGAFSVYIGRSIISEDPQIYAIEPSKDNFRCLVKNIELNNFKNIKCFNLAISDKSGIGRLNIDKGFDSFSLVEDLDKKDHRTEDVIIKTLEDFCSENKINSIDLLKIDIEGGEYAVLEKSLSFIKHSVDTIFIELHWLDDLRNIKVFEQWAINNNFRVLKKIMNRTLVLKNLEK